MDELLSAISQFSKKTVLVVGDIMLDRYTFGRIERMSPEAPIPVVRKTNETHVLGGAANVANNVAALGARAILCGVLGEDSNKEVVIKLLKEKSIDTAGIVISQTKPTTVKQRIIAGESQQVVRIDEEDTASLDEGTEKELLARVKQAISSADVIVFSDYAKGVFSKELAQTIIGYAKESGKSVLVDLKPVNKEFFIGVDVISPNLKEGKEMSGLEHPEAIGRALMEYFKSSVLLTRGGDGISVFTKENAAHHHIPGKKITVFDVSGAGDTAIAVAGLSLAAGLPLESAAFLANVAGAVVVQKSGTATLSREELVSELRLEHHIERVDVVPKVWGYEKWLENNDKYCSKLLSLSKGYQCSLHYHKNKDEMFIVTKGHIRLELGGEVMHLREGGFVRVPPGTHHRFTGIEDSLILEVSTHHEDADSYRLEESRKVE